MIDSETVKYKMFLESSTTKELIKLADQAGISIPPDLDRIFIIRELLDNVLDEEANSKPLFDKYYLHEKKNIETSAMFSSSLNTASGPKGAVNESHRNSSLNSKTASLPQQYHITYLEVLSRDPQWVYVFWEIKAQDRERYEAAPGFEGYALKALENKKTNESSPENCRDGDFTESFTVPVGNDDNSWYLGFPAFGIYRIALWVRGLNTTVIMSRPFIIPKFLNNPENTNYLSSPLIRLSGVSEFSILRSADRVSYNRS
ncbi:MAG: DUF4912 domain-containing protein [Treponema sp.]|nr:DUF4912 domain-containing protein [Treponema sp.]